MLRSYPEQIKLVDHLLALGQTEVYLQSNAGFPWEKVSDVDFGGAWRLGIPTVLTFIVRDTSTINFRLDVSMEEGANGAGTHRLAMDELRAIAMKLNPIIRQNLGMLLASSQLPAVRQHTKEIREALNKQWDAEDRLRGLITFLTEAS